METLRIMNFVVTIIFMVCYSYQFVYIPLSWFLKRKEEKKEAVLHRFAVMICARNEEAVIGDLIDSLKHQTYPADHISIFVIADNCTDGTAEIARAAGATVYERTDKEHVGKGFALQALRRHISEDYPDGFDGYFVLDADNVLAKNYVEEMNKTFSAGHDIITSYRNSKNYGSNWVSAGYGLWFIRESRYLQYPRYLLHTSAAVSGTGFLFSRAVADEIVDWPYFMLTEDIQFSADQIVKGRKIAMCRNAELFDEQPITFRQSWRQRMRWAKGYLQVFRGYGAPLIKGALKGSFSCFDMVMNIAPAFILSLASLVLGLALGVWGAIIGDNILIGLRSLGELALNIYSMLFGVGLISTITEWNHIHTKKWKKILYTFTFPIFMFTYIPIAVLAIFLRTTWKPINHTMSVSKLKQTECEEATDIFE